jgi:hypothetical protein
MPQSVKPEAEFYFALVALANSLKVQISAKDSDTAALLACTKRAKELMTELEKISHPITEWKY